MSNLTSLPKELILRIFGYLSTTDRYHLVRANLHLFDVGIGQLYRSITLVSPDSSKGLCLLRSAVDLGKRHHVSNIRVLRIEGTSPKDISDLDVGEEGSALVKAILRQCLPPVPPIPPNTQSQGSGQSIRDRVVGAHRSCRASLHASTGFALTSIALTSTLAMNIESIEWLALGSGPEATPLQLIRAIIDARTACGQITYPALYNLEWRMASGDTHVPIVPNLKRLVVHAELDQDVEFDLTAMANDGKSQIEELVLSGGEIVTGLEGLLASDHLLRLRVLRMYNFSRPASTSYRRLQDLLCRRSPRLETLEWDFEYTVFNEPSQPSTHPSLQPKLYELTGVKNAMIHSQLLSPNPSNMRLSDMYRLLPRNLEYFMLTGLNMGAIIQLDDDGEDDEEQADEEAEQDEEEREDDDLPDVDEADDSVLKEDPFFLHRLCARLPSLKRVAFRFDFHETSLSALDRTLQIADIDLRRLVVKGQFLGVAVGIYLRCMEVDDASDTFYMGTDVQAA
ncbi:hypothetical protein J3E71DRAFT_187062 [Bipolaris maydis]|nr:hypothetical protein J3E71DRAFT_187062 [Bipolaris maydis]